jgi:ArsR family transcriptional regulator
MDISSGQLTTAMLAALGSDYRMRMVELLAVGERCVCEIAPHFPTSQSVVSHHLAILERTGLIISRRDGRWMRYRLADESVLVFLDQARQLARFCKGGRRTARRPKASERKSGPAAGARTGKARGQH